MIETRDESPAPPLDTREPIPGVVVVFSNGPKLVCEPFGRTHRIAIGRDDPMGSLLTDERLSRHHAVLTRKGSGFALTELGSRNGTFADGAAVSGEAPVRAGSVVRAGGTVLVVTDDIRPLLGAAVETTAEVVRGPRLAEVLGAAARARDPLAISGETGSGKELAARAFHGGTGPFVAVNCATIPDGLAERILFGATRGAFSGATSDAAGLVRSAHGGVLFLDEVGELTPAIQAKLLRVMETGEVTALGATSAQKTQVRFCLASPLHLRAEAAAGRFRQDLLYRVHTHVVVPPLRERREEIAYLVAWELARAGSLRAHSRFIEACLLRPWPGNVRELLSEVRAAADAARAVGTDVVRLEHLAAEGGAGMSTGAPLTRESIQHALAHASGNISEAARVLGLHRTQLRRTMDKLGIAAKSDS